MRRQSPEILLFNYSTRVCRSLATLHSGGSGGVRFRCGAGFESRAARGEARRQGSHGDGVRAARWGGGGGGGGGLVRVQVELVQLV